MKRTDFAVTAALSSLLSLVACNADFDISKLDKSIAIGQGLDMPTGINDTAALKLNSILKLPENSIIKTDEGGDLFMSLDVAQKSLKVKFDKITFGEVHPNVADVSFTIPAVPSESYFDIIGGRVEYPFETDENEINVNQAVIPGIIREFDYFGGESTFQFHFNVPNLKNINGFALSKDDFSIALPEWIKDVRSLTSGFKVNGNTIVIDSNNDFYVDSNSSFDIAIHLGGMDLTKFDGINTRFTPGTVGKNDGQLYIKDKFTIKGTIILTKNDVNTYPVQEQNTNIVLTSTISSFTVTEAKVKILPDLSGLEISPVNIDQSRLPSFLTEEGAVIDAAGKLDMQLSMDNKLPLGLDISTRFVVVNTNSKNNKITMDFGSLYGKSSLYFTGNKLTEHKISRDLSDTDKKLSLFYAAPKTISVDGFNVAVDDKFVVLKPDTDYSINFGVKTSAKLGFGDNMDLSYVYEIKDLSFDFNEITLKDATFTMEIVNAIPVTIEADPYILDANGNVIEDLVITKDIHAVPGTHLSPSVNQASIKVYTDKPESFSKIKGIKLILYMNKGSKDVLNINQGLIIRNLALHTDNGIEITF